MHAIVEEAVHELRLWLSLAAAPCYDLALVIIAYGVCLAALRRSTHAAAGLERLALGPQSFSFAQIDAALGEVSFYRALIKTPVQAFSDRMGGVYI